MYSLRLRSQLEIERCVFANHRVDFGTVYVQLLSIGIGQLRMSDSVFVNNSGVVGAGVYVNMMQTMVLNRCNFTANHVMLYLI